jgi:hypothetical protein
VNECVCLIYEQVDQSRTQSVREEVSGGVRRKRKRERTKEGGDEGEV